MTLDAQGRAWLAGGVDSQAFTATPGVFQPQYAAGNCLALGLGPVPSTTVPCSDLFLMRLNATGTEVEAATYFGGASAEDLTSLIVGGDGFVYLSGYSSSSSLPGLDPNAARAGGGFVAKIAPDLGSVGRLFTFAGQMGGTAVAADGTLFVASYQCGGPAGCLTEVTRIDAGGPAVIWRKAAGATPLALTPGDDSLWVVTAETAWKIDARTGEQIAQVTLPRVATVSSAVSTPAGGVLVAQSGSGPGAFLTQLGPTAAIEANLRTGYRLYGFAMDAEGVAHIAGQGRFAIPISARALARCPSTSNDWFLLGWDANRAAIRYGTYSPQHAGPIAERNGSILLLRGQPVTVDAVTPRTFEEQPPCLTWPLLNWAAAIPSNISESLKSVAPGEFVTVYGSGIGPVEESRIEMDGVRTSAPRSLEGVRVLFNGIPAAMIAVSPDVLLAQVPYDISGSDVEIKVERDDITTNAIEMNVAPAVPSVISTLGAGNIAGAAFNEDWTVNSAANPAKPGEVVAIFVSGAGRLGNIADDAAAVPFPPPGLVGDVRAFISGSGGQVVTSQGGVAGQLPGLVQVNVRIAPDFAYHGRQTLELWFENGRILAEVSVP